MQPTPVVVGIDLGSTSTRAYLWNPETGRDYPVENTRRNYQTKRYENGDFSSIGYPFEKGPVYVGEKLDPDRTPISLKFGMYVLAGAKDELVEEYEVLKPLLERADDPALRYRLESGLRELFTVLHKNITEACTRQRFSIAAIGLSIPSQWDLDFESVYRDIVATTFQEPPDKIFFHTETESLAHYLFKEEFTKLDVLSDDVILFLDFGGHNMNGCMFSVSHNTDGGVSFFRYGEPFGAGGGSEAWEFSVAERCELEIKKMCQMTRSDYQRILDSFNVRKAELGPENDGSFREWGEGWQVNLDALSISKYFDKALERPLQLAANKIQNLGTKIRPGPSNRGYKARVVVCGGTSRHRALQTRIRKLCADEGLPDPIFTTDMRIKFDSLKIAKGVAYAVGSRSTIEQFFAQGAAIGLHRKRGHVKNDPNPAGYWDDIPDFLYSTTNQAKLEFHTRGNDEFALICHPYFESDKEKNMHYDRCYDFLYLGKLANGWWQLDLDIRGSGNNMELVLNHSRKPPRRHRYQRGQRILPLYIDRGTNCAHVGKPGCTVEEGIGGPLGLGTGPRTPAAREDKVAQENKVAQEDKVADCVMVQTDIKSEPPDWTGNTGSILVRSDGRGELRPITPITPCCEPSGSRLDAPHVPYESQPPHKRQRGNEQRGGGAGGPRER